MKQGGLIIAGLVLMFTMIALPVMAEDAHVNYETYIVDNFDSQGTDWTWKAVGSKFVGREEVGIHSVEFFFYEFFPFFQLGDLFRPFRLFAVRKEKFP